MNVGISVLTGPAAHVWSSGLNQNLAFLVMLLRASRQVDTIYLLNGGDSPTLPIGMDFAVAGAPLVRPQDVTHDVDVVIEMGAQMPPAWLQRVRALGAKVVLFLVGQAYSSHIEYPLVHNSEFIKDCGYYYPHFDCQAGGQALLRAFMEHDQRLADEKRSTAALLASLDVADPANIAAYTRELLALFEPR